MGTRNGVVRFLEQQGMRFLVPGQREVVGDAEVPGFLDETYQIERPWFADRDLPGGWKLQTRGAEGDLPERAAPADLVTIRDIANAIKFRARTREPVPAEVLAQARQTQLGVYVAARLLWDPFLDTSMLIGEFQSTATQE